MSTTIVIVEDEGLIALDLKKKLEALGYSVPMVADNSEDALAGVEALQPSLVLVDIRLRGEVDGVEIADQIRRRFGLPVMFVTAHADAETLARAKITEPFGYIVKPFHGVDFRAQIEMALWKHKMEQRLRDNEALLSATFRNVADPLIATDSAGNVAFINGPASEATGWPPQEAVGQSLLEVFQAYDETSELPLVHPLVSLRNGTELGGGANTFKLLQKDGSDWTLVEAEFSANLDKGSLLGVIVVFRGIAERRKKEAQERQWQKMNALMLLAMGLGKGLSQSQTGLAAILSQLVSDPGLGAEAVELFSGACELLTYQRSVVQQLLRLGRSEPGEAIPVDVNTLLLEQEPRFRRALGSRSLTFHLDTDVPLILAEPEDLKENFFSLILDARNAMAENGEIQVTTSKIDLEEGEPGTQIVIRDNGACIRSSAKQHVFDPFYQARPGSRNPGVTLALVHQYVVLNGGTIEVESTPGVGTAYFISFPAATSSDRLAQARKPSLFASTGGGL